ncbi:kelch repeat-containing protein [Besnoitia besnoiti]|uniref:Kelch repeat-containing protein n=1 Tax=Besnoitia besnoiti TaxID=94643 RepID=A0A2A9M5D7_BESBE|nr:kelch repeat-containing protein [Besnoitia besnoiti]PFH33159.1 kelch repeat-containing protein [Besnoitia besnoiti]
MSDLSDFSASDFSRESDTSDNEKGSGKKGEKKSLNQKLFGKLKRSTKTDVKVEAVDSDSAPEVKDAKKDGGKPQESKKPAGGDAISKTSKDTKTEQSNAKPAAKESAATRKGRESSSPESATGILSPPDFFFSSIVHDGKVFQARTEHLVVEFNNIIYIWGGSQAGTIYDDLISFDPSSNTFSTIAVSGKRPSARTGASLVARADRGGHGLLTLWGGHDGEKLTNQTWNFDTTTRTWTNVATKSTPSARKGHSMCGSGDALYLFGGMDSVGVTADGYVLKGEKWTKLKGDELPPARCFHTGTIANTSKVNAMFVFGGDLSGSGRPANDLWRYDIKREEWSLISDASGEAPAPRFKHASAFYEERIWISGGQTAGWFSIYAVSDFFAYDVAANYWFKCDVAVKQLGYHANFGSLALVPQTKALYIFGGSDSRGQPTSDVYRLAPVCTTFAVLDLRRELTETSSEIKQMQEEVDKSAVAAGRTIELAAALEKDTIAALSKVADLSLDVDSFQKGIADMIATSSACKENVERVRQRLDSMELKFVTFAQFERKFELIEASITEIFKKLEDKADTSAVRKIASQIHGSDSDDDNSD